MIGTWKGGGSVPTRRSVRELSCSLETQSRQGTVPSGTGTIIDRLCSQVNTHPPCTFQRRVHNIMHTRVHKSGIAKRAKSPVVEPSFSLPIVTARLSSPRRERYTRRHEMSERYTSTPDYASTITVEPRQLPLIPSSGLNFVNLIRFADPAITATGLSVAERSTMPTAPTKALRATLRSLHPGVPRAQFLRLPLGPACAWPPH